MAYSVIPRIRVDRRGQQFATENFCSRELKTAEYKFFCVAMGYVMI